MSDRTTRRRPGLPDFRRYWRKPAFLDRTRAIRPFRGQTPRCDGLYSRFATKLPAPPKARAELANFGAAEARCNALPVRESVAFAGLRREILLEFADLTLVLVGIRRRVALDRDLGPSPGEPSVEFQPLLGPRLDIRRIASTGHSGGQRLQSMQEPGSITSMFSPSRKASVGQTSTQSMCLQRMQASVTTKVKASAPQLALRQTVS